MLAMHGLEMGETRCRIWDERKGTRLEKRDGEAYGIYVCYIQGKGRDLVSYGSAVRRRELLVGYYITDRCTRTCLALAVE